MTHEDFMREALAEARIAYASGEVPIGAVAVCDGEVVARAHNEKENRNDATAHAEMILLQNLAKDLERWRLTDITVYATIEPCVMCMGALMHARVEHLVFGARDPKFGAARSLYSIGEDERLNHRFEVTEGILAEEASLLMKQFFQERRNKERCPSG